MFVGVVHCKPKFPILQTCKDNPEMMTMDTFFFFSIRRFCSVHARWTNMDWGLTPWQVWKKELWDQSHLSHHLVVPLLSCDLEEILDLLLAERSLLGKSVRCLKTPCLSMFWVLWYMYAYNVVYGPQLLGKTFSKRLLIIKQISHLSLEMTQIIALSSLNTKGGA